MSWRSAAVTARLRTSGRRDGNSCRATPDAARRRDADEDGARLHAVLVTRTGNARDADAAVGAVGSGAQRRPSRGPSPR